MLAAVIKLRSHGRALTRSELAAQPRVVGHLRIEDPPRPRGIRRLVRLAELYGQPLSGGQPQTVLRPLLNPELVEVTEAGLVLFGFELRSNGDQRLEYVQGWLVTPARPDEPLTKRGDVPE